jgi:tRNA pseudouridine55 synthase
VGEPGIQRVKIPRVQIDGVLLLDKPLGLSSNDALMRVKRITRALKLGHGGTLDPLATGLLPIAFGEATKFLQGMLDANKTYLADIKFGQTTTTADREGDVLETKPVTHDEVALLACLKTFCGEQSQVPPMYSALKHEGTPLYKLAREGVEIDRPARQITIFSIDLLEHTENSARIRVACSKGTYIRTLAEDVGKALGCGAHLAGLRREEVTGFHLNDALTLDQIQTQIDDASFVTSLLPTDAMISSIPRFELDQVLAQRMMQGQRLRLSNTTSTGKVRMYFGDVLLGLGNIDNGVLSPLRLIQFSQSSLSNLSLSPPSSSIETKPAAQEALVH